MESALGIRVNVPEAELAPSLERLREGLFNTAIMGLDYGVGGDASYTSVWEFHRSRTVTAETARSTANLIAETYDIHVEGTVVELQKYTWQTLRFIFDILGLNPAIIGLSPASPSADDNEETYHASIDALDFTSRLRPAAPSTPTVSRFDREPEIEDGPSPSLDLPAPRDGLRVAPHMQHYFNRRPEAKAAWEKLHGAIGDISTPTRFERINWNDE